MRPITRISELPDDIRVLAERNRENYSPGRNEDRLYVAFAWNNTPEGYQFWQNIYGEKEVIQEDDQIIM